MPFMKGPAPWRRTLDYLKSGTLVFKEKVKVCSISYHETEPTSEGLKRFVFWHLPQIQYKNPNVQCVQLKNIVKSPFITFHLINDNNNLDKVLVNCYMKTQSEILDYCQKLVGKTALEIEQEAQKNPANFGKGCSRFCMCQVPDQVACPRYKRLPHYMRGKYYHFQKEKLDDIRKYKPDEQALKEYWERK